ncbi:cupin domain-containing protein [Paenibacillus sp. PR3]|uniref:Cupin domain-containing protein n=1 Tax=Paenibacillus terricola TaxID=2763503 RepID=A0ABR8N2L0_9BACL|nr:sugar phosphate nucleotidyltransferase [Paenibacillus terricola]MBD3920704.1 cupin domain-containing protein [Paenibacillus terricola]
MRLILLSGGSGKRLWPLSNDSRSKQFLPLLEDENNQRESMVQRVYRQLKQNGLSAKSYIATGQAQVEVIHNQIGNDVRTIVEPERRDTFPAIALAASYVYSMESASLDETIVVLPVDPYVEDHFFTRIQELETCLHDSQADIGLLGVKPTYPSEKYGYIVPQLGSNSSTFTPVSHFEEKPSEAKAIELIKQEALWNCGVFAFRLEYIVNHLVSMNLSVHYEELLKQYNQMKKISFDYEVVEKADKIIVLPYDGYWKDLGTWNTLTEEMGSDKLGNVTMSDDSKNTHVINELDIPITVLGISNAVVAASPDGILISDKVASPRIKDLIKDLDQRPMYEERRWGRYRVLDFIKYPDGSQVLTKRIHISPNCNLSYQYHLKRREVWTIVSGSGEMVLDGRHVNVTSGDIIVVQPNMRHSIRALTELEIIEVQTGDELIEEDIVRLELQWENILRNYVQISDLLKEV